MTLLKDRAQLVERLRADAMAQEERLRGVLLAVRSGEVDTTSALNACGLELHSLKGAACLVQMSGVATAIGNLSEHMLRKAPPTLSTEFWVEFEVWFGSLIDCIENDESEAPELVPELVRVQTKLSKVLASASSPSPGYGGPLSPTFTPSFAPSAGRRLLIIEDSPTVKAALTALLTQAGYPVECADDMVSVARKLREFDPEIVICDVNMPGVAGDEICRRIKGFMRKVVPVILYSGIEPSELAERAQRARADGYVSKQEGIHALISCMNELLGEEILF